MQINMLSDEARKAKSVIFNKGLASLDRNRVNYEPDEINSWYDSLSRFRNELADGIQDELRRIKNSRN